MKQHFEAMRKAGLSLAFFAFISVLFVAVTDQLTHDKIIENQRLFLLNALNQVIPADQYDNDLIKSKVILASDKTGFPLDTPLYFATKKGHLVAAIFEVTTLDGYNGAIKILVGVNTTRPLSIAGVRAIQHTETPGLGDRMEIQKSNWVLSFNGKSIGNPEISRWKVKKDGGDFDQFTGATITPRAIVNAVRSTLLYAKDNLQTLYKNHTKPDDTVTPDD
jgi:electron transport complex protein RnfG